MVLPVKIVRTRDQESLANLPGFLIVQRRCLQGYFIRTALKRPSASSDEAKFPLG
jgi:hypothetical protein